MVFLPLFGQQKTLGVTVTAECARLWGQSYLPDCAVCLQHCSTLCRSHNFEFSVLTLCGEPKSTQEKSNKPTSNQRENPDSKRKTQRAIKIVIALFGELH